MPFILNPKRRRRPTLGAKVRYALAFPFVRLGLALGFQNVDYSYVHGDVARLSLGERVSTVNTLFNTNSGRIVVGDDTVFGHDCMVLTGVHRFYKGRRVNLCEDAPFRETPAEGNDVFIGKGCFLGSRSVVLGPVRIGDDVIVGAGAVVTQDLPGGCFAAGVPARVIKFHVTDGEEPADEPGIRADQG